MQATWLDEQKPIEVATCGKTPDGPALIEERRVMPSIPAPSQYDSEAIAALAATKPIRVMSALLAAQIAAGEVIERPASVVKELIENALDAMPRQVLLELEQGGIELVRVTDDGAGIPEEELLLALAAHATSKLTSAEDLERISTLGFRGEALASIVSISRLTLRSRTRAQLAAAEVRAEGDLIATAAPAAGPVGTAVEVRNLFFNTPARRKFLRTAATEQGRCLDVLTDLAMAHPAVGFTAICEGRVLISCPPDQSPRARAVLLLGEELDGELLEVSRSTEQGGDAAAIWGLVGKPSLARHASSNLHLFVNGRVVRDKTLQHAAREAYRGLIEPGRWPTAVLMLEVDPARVDVNVHPTKSEVRFRDQSAIHQVVYRAVKETLASADLVSPFTPLGGTSGASGQPGGGFTSGREVLPQAGFSMAHPAVMSGSEVRPATPRMVTPDTFTRYFNRFVPAGGAGGSSRGMFGHSAGQLGQAGRGGALPLGTFGAMAAVIAAEDAARSSVGSEGNAEPAEKLALQGELIDATPVAPALQVHNSYLLTQDEVGVVIVDQHALHERVMFEKLLARMSNGPLESQQLLVPPVFKATRAQMEALESLSGPGGLLARVGINIEPIGPTALAVQAFTTLLFERGVEPAEFCSELLERTAAEPRTGDTPSGTARANSAGAQHDQAAENALREVLDMMACKAAIKAGNHLSDLELAELLALRETVERSSNCPHGRPTSIRLSMGELAKMFGRS